MKATIIKLLYPFYQSLRDILPIVAVIAFFQLFILRQPLPDIVEIVVGALLVVIGLTLFLRGLEMGLFPLGENMAYAFARKGSVFWLLLFAFALGFGTTVAEPALTAIAEKAGELAAKAGALGDGEFVQRDYVLGLRITVAVAVGFAIVLGVLRILKGWPIQWLIIGGYVAVMILTPFAPAQIIGIAYDSGGVTTSTITVPLITALGVGLASSIRNRNPIVDGFGLIALASLTPVLFVMGYGILLS